MNSPEEFTAAYKKSLNRSKKLKHLYQELGTLKAVAEKVGLTPERVRQIIHRVPPKPLENTDVQC